MGIAASNIQGITIHSALCLGPIKSKQPNSNAKSISDLQAMWTGTDWVIIDEILMVSCQLLAEISSALSIAKGNMEPFGGIHLVYAGDFGQLPPVCKTKLFARW